MSTDERQSTTNDDGRIAVGQLSNLGDLERKIHPVLNVLVNDDDKHVSMFQCIQCHLSVTNQHALLNRLVW